MAEDISLEKLASQKAGRYLSWKEQVTGSTSTVAADYTGSAGVDGVDVQSYQVAKIAVVPTEATMSFNVQLEYDGYSKFLRVDQSERTDVTYPWTQEINISGVSRIYTAVTAFASSSVSGDYDVRYAVAKSSSTGSL